MIHLSGLLLIAHHARKAGRVERHPARCGRSPKKTLLPARRTTGRAFHGRTAVGRGFSTYRISYQSIDSKGFDDNCYTSGLVIEVERSDQPSDMCEGARIRRHHQRIEAARAAQVKKRWFDEVCRRTSNLEFWYAIRGTAPESVKSSRGGLFQGVTSSGLVNACAITHCCSSVKFVDTLYL
jgi:hypothetical protein